MATLAWGIDMGIPGSRGPFTNYQEVTEFFRWHPLPDTLAWIFYEAHPFGDYQGVVVLLKRSEKKVFGPDEDKSVSDWIEVSYGPDGLVMASQPDEDELDDFGTFGGMRDWGDWPMLLQPLLLP